MKITSALTLAATAADGLLAGASLDQSIKQLPARRRIGSVAYSEYSRASDLGYGIAFYGILGIGAAALTIAAAVAANWQEPESKRTRPLNIAAALAVAHSLATTQAAPTNFSQRGVARDDERALSRIFDKFERWQGLRAALQVANLGAMIWAVAESVTEHDRGTVMKRPNPRMQRTSRKAARHSGRRPLMRRSSGSHSQGARS